MSQHAAASESGNGCSFFQTLLPCLPSDEAKCSQVEEISWPSTLSCPGFVILLAMKGIPSPQIFEAYVLTAVHIARTGNESGLVELSCSARGSVTYVHQ